MTNLQTFGLFPFVPKAGARVYRVGQGGLWKKISIAFVFCLAAAIASPAQKLTTLVSFDGSNGAQPYLMSLVQGTDGNFYGTTTGGPSGFCVAAGFVGCGTVFKITPKGTLTTLYSFCSQANCTDGYYPYASLVQGTDGNFYGTTYAGGASSACGGIECGTVFKITPGGTLTTLHSFELTDGSGPAAGLVQGTNGNFYGTTLFGGASSACGGTDCGTVFKITAEGKLTTLHSFDATDGAYPYAGLVQGTDGNFYGATSLAGPNDVDVGTVFKITPQGMLTTLFGLEFPDGAYPWGGLVQAASGNFYGTTTQDGINNDGTVFTITPKGELTVLHSFDGTDGFYASDALVQATDGNFYGTTTAGGASGYCVAGCGTLFKMTPKGTLTTLYSFCTAAGCPDGEFPYGGLVQGTDGNFYGTTYDGGASSACGASGCGTVFSLSVGLGPFVKTNPTSGKVGAKVTILGNGLTGATSVTFNGTAATFTAVRNSEITTTVPAGATTGTVEVTAPKGMLKSNLPFRVTP